MQIIKLENKEYSKKLSAIYDPPKQIYCLGNINLLNQKGYAIIGSRECSNYGMVVAKQIGEKLIKQNFTVISGLAKGIDAYAHIGAISMLEQKNKMQKDIEKNKIDLKIKSGNIIAVLGSGLKNIYPAENIELAKKIIKNGGLIITEYPPETKPKPENFPKRNRIISGLSEGIIVVEAKKRSGTFITVDCALEQGRDVYAVPGNITSSNSEGTNDLIKQGAIPFCNFSKFKL